MENEWTPPSDAVEVKGSSFVPPSDAVEVKKKNPTVSGSAGSSSERLTTTTTKATVSSSSKGKPNGTYSYPGNENYVYKKEGGQWFVASKSDYKYMPLKTGDVQGRINLLEKKAVSLEQYGFETEPRKEAPLKYTAPAAPKPIAKPKTEAQQREQELFDKEFKALDKTDPEYLRKKAQADAIAARVNQITPDFINDNEEDVVPKVQQLIKDYPYLQVSQSGNFYDELEIVNTVTNERKKINLENWTSDRDREEAKRLQGFLDVQMSSKEYVNQYQKVNNIKQEMEAATPTQRINLSQKLLEEQAKLNDLSGARYNYAKNDKYRSSAIYDKNAKENIKVDFARLQLQSIDFSEKANDFKKWNDTVEESRRKGLITEEQYLNDYLPKIEQEKQMLLDEQIRIKDDFRKTKSDSVAIDQIAADEFAVEAERGNLLTVTAYSALEGAENSLRFLLETGDFKDGEFKGLLTQAAPGSISDEYTTGGKMSFLETAVSGITNSIASGIVGAAIGSPTLGLYAASYVNTKDQMNTPEFADTPEWQKILFSGALGGTVGLIDKYGISRAFSKTPAGKGLTNWILKKVLSEVGEKATTETIELAVKKNIGLALSSGLIQVTSAGLIEGSTELLQESADMVYKDIFNKMSETGQFDNPKSWAGVADRLSQSFLLGFAGGAGLQSVTQSLQVAGNEMNKAQINSIEQIIDNPDLKETFRLNLKDQILSGQITKEKAQALAERFNELEGTLNKIPKNVDRFEAFKLINERDEIQKEIAGKDPALVAAQTERVSEINEQLKQLSKDAVQKQTTSEVPIQPGAEVSGEMAQGEPEAGPQEVTQEGQKYQEVGEQTTTQINVAPLFDTKVKTVEEADAIRQSDMYKQYKDNLSKVATDFNVTVDTIDDTIGGYAGVAEVSTVATVSGNWNDIIKFAAAYGALAPEVQDSTIAGRTVEPQTTEHNADRFDIGINNQEAALKAAEDAGFSEDGFTLSGDKIMFFNIFKFPVKDFDNKYATFVDKYLEYGGQITSESKSAVQSEFIDSFRRAEILTEAERNAVQQAGREGLRNAVQEAKQRNFPYTVAKAKADQINLVSKENIDEVISNQDTATKQKLAKNAKLALRAIPEAKIYLHNNTAEYDAAVGEQTSGKEKGTFIGTDMAIHVNMEEARPNTLLHEAFHYVILNKEIDGKTLSEWANSLKSIVKDEAILKKIDKLTSKYKPEEQSEEFISELGSIMADAKDTLSTSALVKFKALINKIAVKIGLPQIFSAEATTQDAVDFINTISKKLATGDQIFANGFQTKIVPADLARKKQVKVTENQKLTFVKKSDIIDFKALVDDIVSKNQTVWFWVADQLGRGMYSDAEINGEHYLDAGPSYALDPENRKNGIIWASGKSKNDLQKLINDSDYIFIISGSPQISKLFNKSVFDLYTKKIGDYKSFKEKLLKVGTVKALKDVLTAHDSWSSLMEDASVDNVKAKKIGTGRKKFLIALNEALKKPNSSTYKVLDSLNAIIDINTLRDGFYLENNFEMGDVMLVLKPTGVGGKANHSTYENNVLGEVIGVPDIIVNSYDIMPEDVRSKYKDDINRAKQQQVVAPYGAGVKKVQQLPERKKQKGFSKREAINAAKDKYDLSVKQRGNTHEQGVESALNDLRKSEWYEESDDIMREEAERELKKFFGQRIKSAPSVGRLMGVKPTKVQVDEAAALKSQLRLEAKAAREAKMDLNAKRKALVSAISAMVKDGKISTRQSNSIINKVGKVNLDNPVMVERLINYAEKVFQRADYQERLSEASKIRKSIRRSLKSKELQAEVAGMAKMFSKVDPFLVEDIDQYISNAENVLNAVRPVRGLEVAIRQAADIAAINEFVTEQIELQEKNKKAELMAVYDYLVESGAITEEMTSKEMQEIIDIINTEESEINDPEKKMNFLKNRFEFMAGIIQKMIVNNEDPFTEESLDLNDRQKELMRQLLKIDMDRLSVKQAALVLEAMDNFMNNGITSGLEAVINNYEGTFNADRLAAAGKRARQLSMYFNKRIGRIFGEQVVSLPLLIERMFPGMENTTAFIKGMGLNDLMRGSAKADYDHKQLIKQYSEQDFYKNKKFMDAKNVYERGMLAFLNRNLIGTETERRNEFLRRINILEESIKALEYGTNEESKMAEVYQEVYDKLKVSEKDLDVIKANAEKMNLDAVEWITNQWASKYSQLSDVSLSVYNSILGSDTNYTPDRLKLLDGSNVELGEDVLSKGGAFMSSIEYVDKNKSGVLIESTRPKTLPKDRFISLDFDANNFRSLKAAMVDIETAASIRKIDGFISSDGFKKMIKSGDDRKLLQRRLTSYIKKVKGKESFDRDTLNDVSRLSNFLATLGVGKALGGLDQPIKQVAPVIINTLANAGRFTPVNAEMNEAINRSGMAIANRGLESITAVESIDSTLEKSVGLGKKAVRGVEDLSQMYMKAFISKPDVWVARSSFITYYQKYLRDNGISTDIDWKDHQWNQEAMDYAQMMVDRQQNISDDKLAGKLLSSPQPGAVIFRKVMLPFATFILNQKARMYNDFITLFGSGISTQDRVKAGKSIGGLAGEMITYHALAYFIRTMVYDYFAELYAGIEDEEEEKDRRFIFGKTTRKQWNATKFPVKSFLTDLLSPFPLVGDDIIAESFDFAMSFYPIITKEDIDQAISDKNATLVLRGGEPMNEKQEAKFVEKLKQENTYSVNSFKNKKWADSYGVPGIAIDTYMELFDLGKMATTGEFTESSDYGTKTKYLTKEGQDLAREMILPMVLFATGVAPKDLGTFARKVISIAKKKSISQNKYENIGLLKEELGRQPKEWEKNLVIKTDKRMTGLVDAINFADRFANLTPEQGEEYVKVIEQYNDYDFFILQALEKNMKAEDIIKYIKENGNTTGLMD